MFMATALEEAQAKASAERALFKCLVSGDYLEAVIIAVARKKTRTF